MYRHIQDITFVKPHTTATCRGGRCKILYERYAELLNVTGKTTAEVCRETGISETTISNWKARGGRLSVDNLKRLADYFGVAMEYFLEET